MNQFRQDTAKILGVIAQFAWFLGWVLIGCVSIGSVAHMCIKAFRLGWGMW